MTESVVREDLESLDIRGQESHICLPAVATRTQPRTAPLTPYFIVSV